jgi:hypothetical protein
MEMEATVGDVGSDGCCCGTVRTNKQATDDGECAAQYDGEDIVEVRSIAADNQQTIKLPTFVLYTYLHRYVIQSSILIVVIYVVASHRPPLRCAVLCCAVLCCAVLCCAVLCCAVLCCAVLCCAVLCCVVLDDGGRLGDTDDERQAPLVLIRRPSSHQSSFIIFTLPHRTTSHIGHDRRG